MKQLIVKQCSPYIGSKFAIDIEVSGKYYHGFLQNIVEILRRSREFLKNHDVTLHLTRECLVKRGDPRPKTFSTFADVRHINIPVGTIPCIVLPEKKSLLESVQRGGYGFFVEPLSFLDELDITKHELLGETVVVLCGTKRITHDEISWLDELGAPITIDNRYWEGAPDILML